MSDYAMLNGERIVSAKVSIPYYGLWAADVGLDTAIPITTPITMTIANLTMVGHVVRMSGFAGQRTARLVGGFGGWRATVSAQAYYNPNGIRKSTVIRDAASAVGEQVNVLSDAVLANTWMREAAPAQRVLQRVVGDTWWVDMAGMTQCAPRTDTRPITSDFLVVHWSGAKGSFEIATEDVAAWTPGRTFSAPTVPDVQSISLVGLNVDGEGTLRLEVLSVDQ